MSEERYPLSPTIDRLTVLGDRAWLKYLDSGFSDGEAHRLYRKCDAMTNLVFDVSEAIMATKMAIAQARLAEAIANYNALTA